jgi:hypothetical protein
MNLVDGERQPKLPPILAAAKEEAADVVSNLAQRAWRSFVIGLLIIAGLIAFRVLESAAIDRSQYESFQ